MWQVIIAAVIILLLFRYVTYYPIYWTRGPTTYDSLIRSLSHLKQSRRLNGSVAKTVPRTPTGISITCWHGDFRVSFVANSTRGDEKRSLQFNETCSELGLEIELTDDNKTSFRILTALLTDKPEEAAEVARLLMIRMFGKRYGKRIAVTTEGFDT